MFDTPSIAHDASVASRPTTSGFGKCTEVVKTLVPEEFKDRLTRHWKSLGFASESDFARECLMCAVLGRGEVEKLHLDRIRQAFGNGHSIGTASD